MGESKCKYLNGKETGTWKFFELNYETQEPNLSYEIEYENGRPIKLKQYNDVSIKNSNNAYLKYNINFELNIPQQKLNATVYLNNKIEESYVSGEDNIDFWDLDDTRVRIIQKLQNPNLAISTNKKFIKPIVNRNPKTGNYTLYDELKRSGKDHAILFATEDYDTYRDKKLRNPIRDAEAIAADLKDIYGFNCTIVKNPTKEEFFTELKKYAQRKFEKDEQLFIFISGHGMYANGMKDGYIIPRDGQTTAMDASHTSWISYSELIEAIEEIKSQHILLAIDACYSGSLEYAVAKSKDLDDPIDRLSDPKFRFLNRMNFQTKMYITSTSADRQASDGIEHSPFSEMLIKGLRSPQKNFGYLLDISEIFGFLNSIIPAPRLDYLKGHNRESSFFFVMK